MSDPCRFTYRCVKASIQAERGQSLGLKTMNVKSDTCEYLGPAADLHPVQQVVVVVVLYSVAVVVCCDGAAQTDPAALSV